MKDLVHFVYVCPLNATQRILYTLTGNSQCSSEEIERQEINLMC